MRGLHLKLHVVSWKRSVNNLYCSFRPGMSNFKQVVIDFLVSKLPVIYHSLLQSYLALSKNIGKNNTTHDFCFKSNIH
jgi:hypothetical protein